MCIFWDGRPASLQRCSEARPAPLMLTFNPLTLTFITLDRVRGLYSNDLLNTCATRAKAWQALSSDMPLLLRLEKWWVDCTFAPSHARHARHTKGPTLLETLSRWENPSARRLRTVFELRCVNSSRKFARCALLTAQVKCSGPWH